MKIKGILAAVAALVLTTGCIDMSALMRFDYDAPVEPKHKEMPAVSQVAETIRSEEWYGELCDSMSRFYDGGYVSSKTIGNSDVKRAIYVMRNDCPEYFWTGNRYGAAYASKGAEVTITYTDHLEERDIPKMYEELQMAADSLIHSIPEGSDYDKVLYVHDYIAEHTVYDKKAAADDDIAISGTAYGCLVNGFAVCIGYAKAFTYIMNNIGIESGICTGSQHAWNWVKLDGKYYWLDITWDDVDYDGYSATHKFFLLSDEQILRGRDFDWLQAEVPECRSGNTDWFAERGCYFPIYDREKVLDCIGSHSDELHCELLFGDYEAYLAALDDLLGAMELRHAKGVDVSRLMYVRNDEMYHIDLVFDGGEVIGNEDEEQ